MEEPRHLSIILVPDGGRASRTFQISYWRLRWMAAGAVVVAAMVTLMAGSWWYLAARAARTQILEERLAEMEADRVQMESFAQQLQELEAQYGRIRDLFGSETSQVTSELWLPPPPSIQGGGREAGDSDDTRPTTWPLTERGFITQTLLEGEGGEHPGLDIAVPTDSYIRAAGPGTVVDVGEDPVYGRFVRLDHGGGYRTLYGHASATSVEMGQQVRRGEVIALSGSTGRSTAPHLHFEILLDGVAVDPLTLVRRP